MAIDETMPTKVINTSFVDGKRYSRVIIIDPIKLDQFMKGKIDGHPQHVFPELPDYDREFLMTGMTPEQWNKIFEKDPEAQDSLNKDFTPSIREKE